VNLPAIILAVSLVTGCDDSPTAPAQSSLTGSWSGSISISGCQAHDLSLEISEFEYQGGRFFDGRWSGACGKSGHATGEVRGNNVLLQLGVDFSDCVLIAIGVRRGENRIEAHLEESRCTGSGSLEFVR
jgi:hypothetical protein